MPSGTHSVSNIINDKTSSFNSGSLSSIMLSLQEGNEIGLVGFLKSDALELKVGVAWP